ncbi:MAG TPA: cysteine synthase family protein [Acidobacteriota bacterium]
MDPAPAVNAAAPSPPAAASTLELVGRTPLIELRSQRRGALRLFAKLESCNPTGSLKDRIVLQMVESAERAGRLDKSKTLIDASSGNTGIAIGMVAALKGYRARIFMPESKSVERRILMRAWGAEVVLTSRDDPHSHIKAAEALAREQPDQFFYLDQNGNPDNSLAHQLHTAGEILEQTGGRVDLFVAGFGTGGTLMGCARRFRAAGLGTRVISVEPSRPISQIEGLLHLDGSYYPPIYDPALIDEHCLIEDVEALEAAHELARSEGLFVGISSGAVLCAARRAAARLDSGHVVMIMGDRGERYLSTALCAAFRHSGE